MAESLDFLILLQCWVSSGKCIEGEVTCSFSTHFCGQQPPARPTLQLSPY